MKWRTKKELPGIPVGAEAEVYMQKGLGKCLFPVSASCEDGEFGVYYMSKYPDFFELVEDEPEFVDVEIKVRSSVLTVILPKGINDSVLEAISIDALARFPEFDAFRYVTGNGMEIWTSQARMYRDCGGILHSVLSVPKNFTTVSPTHARFSRLK